MLAGRFASRCVKTSNDMRVEVCRSQLVEGEVASGLAVVVIVVHDAIGGVGRRAAQVLRKSDSTG